METNCANAISVGSYSGLLTNVQFVYATAPLNRFILPTFVVSSGCTSLPAGMTIVDSSGSTTASTLISSTVLNTGGTGGDLYIEPTDKTAIADYTFYILAEVVGSTGTFYTELGPGYLSSGCSTSFKA
jgi:hypothetical protein